MTPITIDGRVGTVVYVDDAWHPVPDGRATLAAVVFDDGGRAYYKVEPVPPSVLPPVLRPGGLVARLKALLRGNH